MTSGEEWRPVAGFGGYEVSTEGRVRSYRDRQGHPRDEPRILTPVIRRGYCFVKLTRARDVSVHRLVLETFVGPKPENAEECRHLDGCPSNNRLSNLAWGSKVENYADRRLHGTANDGERHGHATLTNELVLQIYRSELADAEAAEAFGVRRGTVSKIRRGIVWTGITGAPAAVKPGTAGSHNGRARLSEEQVLAIRASDRDALSLAAELGVSQGLIYMIRRRQIWRHLP